MIDWSVEELRIWLAPRLYICQATKYADRGVNARGGESQATAYFAFRIVNEQYRDALSLSRGFAVIGRRPHGHASNALLRKCHM